MTYDNLTLIYQFCRGVNEVISVFQAPMNRKKYLAVSHNQLWVEVPMSETPTEIWE